MENRVFGNLKNLLKFKPNEKEIQELENSTSEVKEETESSPYKKIMLEELNVSENGDQ